MAASTVGWSDGTNDYAPFVNYLLDVILAAYRELDERMGSLVLTAPGASGNALRKATKEERIAALFDHELTPLSKADILARMPDISMTTVERTLKTLQDAGRIKKINAGRATRYVAR